MENTLQPLPWKRSDTFIFYKCVKILCKQTQINGVPGIMSGCARNFKKFFKKMKEGSCIMTLALVQNITYVHIFYNKNIYTR